MTSNVPRPRDGARAAATMRGRAGRAKRPAPVCRVVAATCAGWNFTAEATEISPRFRNDNGFVEQAGARILQTELIRRWGEVAVPGPAASTPTSSRPTCGCSTRARWPTGLACRAGGPSRACVHPGIWLVAARNTEAWVQWN